MNFIQWPYVLRRGHSGNPAEGACAMDAANWLAHGAHGDRMACASPAISAFVIHGNDSMPDDVRQRFIPYLCRLAGTRSEAHEADRVRIMVLAAARLFAPRALDAAGQHDHAATLRALPDDADFKTIEAAAAAAEAAKVAKAAKAAGWAVWAARAEAEAAKAAKAAAGWAVWAATAARAWDDYFVTLDAVLNAGPQGEPWSADVVEHGVTLYREAGGLVTTLVGE